MANASTSMSKRAPKAEANLLAACRPAIGAVEQQGGPGDGGEQPPFRRAERIRIDRRGRRSGRRSPARSQRDPIGRTEPGMRMVCGEPALDGEQQTGEQQQAAQRGRTVPTAPPRTGNGRGRDGEPERACAKTERASRIRQRAGRERGDPDRHCQAVRCISAIVPCRDSMDKQPSASDTLRRPRFIPMREARAFWVAAPGRGEIRAQPLALAATRRAAWSGHAASAISRGTESLVFRGEVPRERMAAHALPVSGGRVPGAGQIRLFGRRHCRRRPRRNISDAASSACIRIRTGLSCRRTRSSMFPRTCRTGARPLPPIWKRRSTGCGTPRPARETGLRSSAPAWSAAWSPRSRRGCPAPRSS